MTQIIDWTYMNWDQVVKEVAPYVVKIESPAGHGTGILYFYNENRSWLGIATAYHVIAQADTWQQPIKIHHLHSGINIFLKQDERTIFKDINTDSAVIMFPKGNLPFPDTPVPLLQIGNVIDIGTEVGWLGFPSVAQDTLCFFSGNISARQEPRKAYLIDGVAINGVSGGPVLFKTENDGVKIVGIVTAYSANRTTGEALPGLSIAQDVSHFHGVVSLVQSIDDANKIRVPIIVPETQIQVAEIANNQAQNNSPDQK